MEVNVPLTGAVLAAQTAAGQSSRPQAVKFAQLMQTLEQTGAQDAEEVQQQLAQLLGAYILPQMQPMPIAENMTQQGQAVATPPAQPAAGGVQAGTIPVLEQALPLGAQPTAAPAQTLQPPVLQQGAQQNLQQSQPAASASAPPAQALPETAKATLQPTPANGENGQEDPQQGDFSQQVKKHPQAEQQAPMQPFFLQSQNLRAIKVSSYQQAQTQASPLQKAAQAMLEKISAQPTAGGQSFEIQLCPKELGRVQIQMTVEKETVKLTIACAEKTTQEALMNGFPKLSQVLSGEMGCRVDVEFTPTENSMAGGQFEAGQDHSQQSKHRFTGQEESFEDYINKMIEQSYFFV